MKNLFVPYEQALHLKELGFNEECLKQYSLCCDHDNKVIRVELYDSSLCIVTSSENYPVSAPLYQQAFDFFRKQVFHQIVINDKGDYVQGMLSLLPLVYRTSYEIQVIEASKYHTLDKFSGAQIPLHDIAHKFYGNAVPTYEEAQLQCLIKLIEIAKTK
jgi:hypothetical protein